MNTTKINIQVVEQNRQNLAKFRPLFGARIFRAVRIPVITDFNLRSEQANQNNGLFINRNVYRYKSQSIDITALDLEKGIDDEWEVVINKDKVDEAGNSIEIRCPLGDNKFTKEATVENLAEALKKDGSGKNYYFSSGKQLTEQINRLNDKEQQKADALAAELKKISELLQTTKEKNLASTESYYHQLDGKTEVNVHVNIDNEQYYAGINTEKCMPHKSYVL